MGQAQKLAPQNDQIHYLSGVLESKRGNPTQAIVELRKAVELNPHNLRAMYLLAQEVERQGDANSETEFQQLLEKILAAQPDNPAALLELGRVAAKRGDAQTLHSVVDQLNAHAATWPPEVQQQWTALQTAAAGPDPRAAAVRIAFLRNSLMRVPEFRQSLNVIQPTAGNEAAPFSRFLLLSSPTFTPPPADTATQLPNRGDRQSRPEQGIRGPGSEPSRSTEKARRRSLWPIARACSWRRAQTFLSRAAPQCALQPESILPVDFDYDFKTDLVLAGESGVRFMHQESPPPLQM